MEKANTKEQILDVALDLFSVRGYEATSISQIAEAMELLDRHVRQFFRVYGK